MKTGYHIAAQETDKREHLQFAKRSQSIKQPVERTVYAIADQEGSTEESVDQTESSITDSHVEFTRTVSNEDRDVVQGETSRQREKLNSLI